MPPEIQEQQTQPESAPAAEQQLPDFKTWRESKRNPLSAPVAEASDAEPAVSAPDADTGDDSQSEPESPLEENDDKPKPQDPTRKRRKLLDEAIHWRRKYREAEKTLPRITELSSENLRLKQQLETLQRPNGNQETTPQEAAPPSDLPKRPSLGDFNSVEEWEAAQEKWLDARDEYRDRQKSQQAQQQRQQAEQQRVADNWNKVSAKAERDFPGFNDAVNRSWDQGNVSRPLAQTILQFAVDEPDAAIAVTRYLTGKPEESKRISGLDSHRIGLEVGRLIERFSNPVIVNGNSGTAKPKPAAPATTVLNGSGSAPRSLDDPSLKFNDWKKLKAAAKR
jgi:hypothetical protein